MKTVQYVSFREVVNLVNNAGKGAYIFLIDAQDAYYRVPIQKEDWKYMGIKWAKKLWVFRSLQMGTSSSPRIYTSFADAVEYICVNKDKKLFFHQGLQMLRHYIDDFFGAAKNWEDACNMFKIVFQTFEELGIPTRVDKCFYPWLKRKILGWVYDTILRTAGVPEDKRLLLLDMIIKLIDNPRTDKKSMEKLIGRLQNVSQVTYPGKAFVRRLEAVLHLVRMDYNKPFTLSDFVIEDLKWWKSILEKPELCCTSFDLLLKHPSDGEFKLWSDATTTVGGGGYVTDANNNILFTYQFDWKDTILWKTKMMRPMEIEVLELILSLVGIELLLPQLHNHTVTIYNDNPTAAGAIRTKAPRLHRLDLQYLIRRLASLAVKHKFYFWGIHYTVKDGAPMQLADDLSRYHPAATSQTSKYPKRDAIKVVDHILRELCWRPLNLPKTVDLSNNRRREYSLLLNDDCHDYSNPRIRDVVKTQHEYNILTRKA